MSHHHQDASLGVGLYCLVKNGNKDDVMTYIRENDIQPSLVCPFADNLRRIVTGTGKNAVESNEALTASVDFSDCSLSPLFPAILWVFRKPSQARLDVLKALLDHGFSRGVVSFLRVCHVGQWNHAPLTSVTPHTFTLWLRDLSNERAPEYAALSNVLKMLESVRDTPAVNQRMVPVLAATKEFWTSLLSNANVSDVQLRTVDGELIPAIKAILVAASEYFRALLSGNRSETQPDGVIQTTLHSDIVKAILRFIYTGELDTALLNERANDLLCASCEFMLLELKTRCERQMSSSLTKEILRDAIVTSHLHSCKVLEKACHKFVKRNPGILTKASFFSLAGTHPELWKKLMVALGEDPEAEMAVDVEEAVEGCENTNANVGAARWSSTSSSSSSSSSLSASSSSSSSSLSSSAAAAATASAAAAANDDEGEVGSKRKRGIRTGDGTDVR